MPWYRKKNSRRAVTLARSPGQRHTAEHGAFARGITYLRDRWLRRRAAERKQQRDAENEEPLSTSCRVQIREWFASKAQQVADSKILCCLQRRKKYSTKVHPYQEELSQSSGSSVDKIPSTMEEYVEELKPAVFNPETGTITRESPSPDMAVVDDGVVHVSLATGEADMDSSEKREVRIERDEASSASAAQGVKEEEAESNKVAGTSSDDVAGPSTNVEVGPVSPPDNAAGQELCLPPVSQVITRGWEVTATSEHPESAPVGLLSQGQTSAPAGKPSSSLVERLMRQCVDVLIESAMDTVFPEETSQLPPLSSNAGTSVNTPVINGEADTSSDMQETKEYLAGRSNNVAGTSIDVVRSNTSVDLEAVSHRDIQPVSQVAITPTPGGKTESPSFVEKTMRQCVNVLIGSAMETTLQNEASREQEAVLVSQQEREKQLQTEEKALITQHVDVVTAQRDAEQERQLAEMQESQSGELEQSDTARVESSPAIVPDEDRSLVGPLPRWTPTTPRATESSDFVQNMMRQCVNVLIDAAMNTAFLKQMERVEEAAITFREEEANHIQAEEQASNSQNCERREIELESQVQQHVKRGKPEIEQERQLEDTRERQSVLRSELERSDAAGESISEPVPRPFSRLVVTPPIVNQCHGEGTSPSL